jgi:hypothetical protein
MFGIHTMIDEHFGIALVEMMAGKMIVVAHESGKFESVKKVRLIKITHI